MFGIQKDPEKNRDTGYPFLDWGHKPKEKQPENRGGTRKKVTSSGIRSKTYLLKLASKEDPKHNRKERHGSKGGMRNERAKLTSNQSAYRYLYEQREEQEHQPFGIAMEDRKNPFLDPQHDTKESHGSRGGIWKFGWKNLFQEDDLARRGQYGRSKGQKHQQHSSVTEGLQPISLAKVKNDNFKVDTEALYYLMEKEELKGKPLAIISVAGTTRSGKSFILNFFLKYLRNKGWRNPDWFGDDENQITRDFLWKKGSEACTQGITVWPEIFHVPLNDGQECAVIIVDTQGLYDSDTSPDTNAKLMSLSTLFSSCQILNLMRQMEERDLEHLELSASFAKKAAEMKICRNERAFQTLMFLIRDWEHDDHLGDRTDEYLLPFLSKPSRSPVVQKVKESIFDSFTQALCFRLPRPGEKVVKSANENLCNKDVDEKFKELVKVLVRKVLHPDNIVIKKMASGKKATPNDLKNLFGTLGQNFVKGKIPTAGTLLQNYAQSINKNAVAEAVKIYKENMKSQIGERMINNDDFRKYHEASFDKARKTFDSEADFGDEDSKNESRQHLTIECDYAMKTYKERNETKKSKLLCELQKIKIEWSEKYRTATTPANLSMTDEEFNQIYIEHNEKALKSFNSAAKGLEEVLPEIQCEKNNLKRQLDVKNREATESRNNEKKKQNEEQLREQSKSCVQEEKENFRKKAEVYRKSYEDFLETKLIRMKNEAQRRYEEKMRSNPHKNSESLKEELNKITRESISRNGELKTLLQKKCEKKGREFADQCEEELGKTIDDAYLDPSILDNYMDQFVAGNVKEDEEYKKFPNWGQNIVMDVIQKKRAKLQEQNKRNKKHRSVKLKKWDKFVKFLKTTGSIVGWVFTLGWRIYKAVAK